MGEETALFESIEGGRPEPRNKPPFPVEVGLFGQPTAVNNVETLINVPVILAMGAAAYAHDRHRGLDRAEAVLRVGPRRAARRVRGAVRDDAAASSSSWPAASPAAARSRRCSWAARQASFVGPDRLDMPLTFEGTRAAGATLGSGVVMVFDETADLVDALRRIAAFFRDESCGQCVPCRVGTVRQEELLARLAAGSPLDSVDGELARFADLAQAMRDASICGLGQTASSAIESALRSGSSISTDAGALMAIDHIPFEPPARLARTSRRRRRTA